VSRVSCARDSRPPSGSSPIGRTHRTPQCSLQRHFRKMKCQAGRTLRPPSGAPGVPYYPLLAAGISPLARRSRRGGGVAGRHPGHRRTAIRGAHAVDPQLPVTTDIGSRPIFACPIGAKRLTRYERTAPCPRAGNRALPPPAKGRRTDELPMSVPCSDHPEILQILGVPETVRGDPHRCPPGPVR
jgi:hypothetical protein